MSRVLIDTGLVHNSAKRVAAAQNEVGNAWTALSTGLSAAEGMAGNPGKDRAVAKFVAAYTPAVHAVWRGLATMHRVTGYMSRGLTQTANNHVRADHASMINGQFSMVPRQGSIFLDGPAFQVSGPLNLPAPPSAAGPGKTSPHSLLGSLTGIELIPKTAGGTGESSIGNILDHLED